MTPYPLIEHGLEANGGWAFAPAKVNLWLEVLRRREDGFHDIETLIAPIDLRDRLDVQVSGESDKLTVIGIDVPSTQDNLVMRALQAARQMRKIPPLQIQLTKKIPPRTGLGGGSSDAAAMLVLLAALFPAPPGREELHQQAADIGSDVPFFFGMGPALATGRGEILEAVEQPFLGGDRAFFNLIFPEIGLETSAVYASLSDHLTSDDSHRNFPAGAFQEKTAWVHSLHNRLLDGARRIEPCIDEIARALECVSPGRWTMTGSGSCFIVAATDRAGSADDAEILRLHFRGDDKGARRICPPPVEIMTVSILAPIC
ncbi:MAG: 4-(cytidine 5'-diphospho)-2-C-methyl-D-erythritol kinase [Planctomycetota bacterium]